MKTWLTHIYIYIYKGKKYFYLKNKHYVKLNSKNKLDKLQIISFISGIVRNIKENTFINSIVKKHKIDVVIHNTYHLPKIKPLKNTKYIWVQHFDSTQYIRKKISKLIIKFLNLKDSFYYDKVVTYTKNDIDFLITNKLIKSNSNIVPITLGIINEDYEQNILKLNAQKTLSTSNKQQIAFIGRLDEKQKNINFLNKIIEKSQFNEKKIKIHVYGEGNDKHLLENKPNIVCHDSFKKDQLLNIFSKIKLLVLPSNFEGFPLVIVEALSHGVPCIIANTFLNASFLIDDSRGKLINNFDPQAWVDAINEIMNLNDDDYQKLSNNCLKFAKENLSLEQFNKKWLELIEN